MFGFRSPETARLPPYSSKPTKRFIKRIRSRSSNALPAELCSSCVQYVLDRSEDPTHDIRLVTSLSLTFDGPCPRQEFHVAQIVGMMEGLYHLAILDFRIMPWFYTSLAEKARFQLEYFSCESPLSETLLRFLATQQQLLEFTYFSQSIETQTTRVRGQDVLHSVQTLSTTAPLLLHPQLHAASLRHLDYKGGGQSLKEEVRAIEKIHLLGPQLQSLRFTWGFGKTETFLDVTKFFFIATNTPKIKHIYLSDVSRNVGDFLISTEYFSLINRTLFQIFEQFVTTGLSHRTWKKLQTLVWVPNPPHDHDLDEPEFPLSPAFPSSPRSIEFPDTNRAGRLPRPRRRSTASSWNSTSSSCSARSSITTSTSTSRRTRKTSISDINRLDLSFRIHCIGKDLMTTFPTLRQLALWNWNRLGYDTLTRTEGGSLVWSYRVEIDEDEWLSD